MEPGRTLEEEANHIFPCPPPQCLEWDSGPLVSFCYSFELGIGNPGGCGGSYLRRWESKEQGSLRVERKVQLTSGRDRDKEGYCWCWTALQFQVPFFSHLGCPRGFHERCLSLCNKRPFWFKRVGVTFCWMQTKPVSSSPISPPIPPPVPCSSLHNVWALLIFITLPWGHPRPCLPGCRLNLPSDLILQLCFSLESGTQVFQPTFTLCKAKTFFSSFPLKPPFLTSPRGLASVMASGFCFSLGNFMIPAFCNLLSSYGHKICLSPLNLNS